MSHEEYYHWTWGDWQEAKKDDVIKALICLANKKRDEYPENIHWIRTFAWAFKRLGEQWEDLKGKEIQGGNISCKEDYFNCYRYFLYQWYTYCKSTKGEIKYYFATERLKGKSGNQSISLNQEECLRQLIERDNQLDLFFYSPQNGRLDETGRMHIQDLVTWFTRRYNLGTPWWLIKELEKHGEYWRRSRTPNSTGNPCPRAAVNLMSWLLFGVALFLGLVALSPFLEAIPFNKFFYRVFLILVIIVAFWQIIPMFYGGKSPLRLRLAIPRMLACIFVGYLPLLMTSEVWLGIKHLAACTSLKLWGLYELPFPPMLPLTLIALLLSFGYLLLEVNNAISDWRETFKRATLLCLIGLFWSLTIGLVCLDLVGLPYKKSLVEIQNGKEICKLEDLSWVPGLVGEVPAEALCLFAPLALLIGIFVQIIWEEKPITEPL